MAFEALTPNAEKLLQEIIDHKNDGIVYWDNRYRGMRLDEKERLGSLFKELENNGLVKVRWASNHPYRISIFDDGYTYTERKKVDEKEKKKLNRREWRIAVISAVIGAVIGLIPTIVQWLMGK